MTMRQSAFVCVCVCVFVCVCVCARVRVVYGRTPHLLASLRRLVLDEGVLQTLLRDRVPNHLTTARNDSDMWAW